MSRYSSVLWSMLGRLYKTYCRWIYGFCIIMLACCSYYIIRRYEYQWMVVLISFALALACMFGCAYKSVRDVGVRIWHRILLDLIKAFIFVAVIWHGEPIKTLGGLICVMYGMSLMYVILGEKWWEVTDDVHNSSGLFISKRSAIVYAVLICITCIVIFIYDLPIFPFHQIHEWSGVERRSMLADYHMIRQMLGLE